MSQEPSYWQDLLTDVANDLDLMLGDLCQEKHQNEQGHSVSRTEPLHEQSMQGVGQIGSSPSPSSSPSHVGSSHFENDSTQSDGIINTKACATLSSLAGQQSSIGTLTSATSASESSEGSTNFVVDIGILERLICTHSIWFLPDILRGGTVHLLQGKEVGNFIIRKSSKPETLALTVRLPPSVGPHIEHYLIEKVESGEFHLEGSESLFSSVPVLVAHYSQCCDELPVALTLPSTLALASSRQELLSISLLGQDFWSSPSMFSSPEPPFCAEHPPHRPSLPTHKPPLPTPISPVESNSTIPETRFSTPSPPIKPMLEPAPPIPTAPKPPLRAAPPIPTSIPSSHIAPNVPENDAILRRGKMNGSSAALLRQQEDDEASDSPGLYYHSCLADKVSDYEDIWGTEKEKKTFSTFKPQQRPLSSIAEKNIKNVVTEVKKENVYIQAQMDPKEMVSMWTQTEADVTPPPSGGLIGQQQRHLQCSLSVQDIRNHDLLINSSRFYSEPVDKLPPTTPKRLFFHRHSDPNIVATKKPVAKQRASLENINNCDGNEKDEVCLKGKPPVWRKNEAKSVPMATTTTQRKEMTWEVDSSWEWMNASKGGGGGDNFIDDSPLYSLDMKFPVNFNKAHNDGSQVSDTTTVEDLLTLQSPELLLLCDESPSSSIVGGGASEYDNFDTSSNVGGGGASRCRYASDHIDDSATEFSEPWDSHRWERVLQLMPQNQFRNRRKDDGVKNNENMKNNLCDTTPLISFEDSTDSASVVSSSSSTNESEKVTKGHQEFRTAPFRSQESDIGEAVRQYIYRLALEKNNTFAMAIENFIQCTKESNEVNPAVIMRNIRQFMTGMKNYLLKHGEGQFEELVQTERGKLRTDEFLNIDAIVEGTLHKLVIKPLKNYIYQLFVDAYKSNGSLQLLSDNIKQARNKSKEEMGIRDEFQPPEGPSLEIVRHFLLRLQQEYSPVKKLENLLAAISTIYSCVQQKKCSPDGSTSNKKTIHNSLGADDFLPIFIYVLVHCGMISAEIEADFMWGLLQPSMLSGEGGYYLTTLSSSVHVLKNLQSTLAITTTMNEEHNAETMNNDTEGDARSGDAVTVTSDGPRLPSIADLQGFMKIVIPDELSGSIISKTLPVRPNMTTKDVCKMIALKFKISNPQDHGLFKLVKGDETQLGDNESPQTIKADLYANGQECLFAYKRCDANFIWPVLH